MRGLTHPVQRWCLLEARHHARTCRCTSVPRCRILSPDGRDHARSDLSTQSPQMRAVASEQTSRQVKGMLAVSEQLQDDMVLSESCVKVRTSGPNRETPLNLAPVRDLPGRAHLDLGLDVVYDTSGRRKPAGRHLVRSDCSHRRRFSALQVRLLFVAEPALWRCSGSAQPASRTRPAVLRATAC